MTESTLRKRFSQSLFLWTLRSGKGALKRTSSKANRKLPQKESIYTSGPQESATAKEERDIMFKGYKV